MADAFLRSVPSDSDRDDVRLYDPTQADAGGGASITGTIAFTLDDLAASLAAVTGHPGTVAFALDDIAAAISGATGHPATLSALLADLSADIAATNGHPTTLSATLADLSVDIAATVSGGSGASITGTLEVVLDGLEVAIRAEAFHVTYGWANYRRRAKKRDAEDDIEEAAQLVQADAKATQEAKDAAQALIRAAKAAQGFRELRLLDAQVRWLLRQATEARVRDDEETIVTWLLLH